MTVQVYDEVAPLARDWDALADDAGASPFQRPGWVGAWWDSFGQGTPEIHAVRTGGRLTGVLPLYRRAGVVRTMADDHAVESGFLAADSAAAAALARSLIEAVDHRGSLLFVDPTRPGLSELRAVAAATHRQLVVRPMEHAPYVVVEGDWQPYYERRHSRLRAELRRRRRRLEEQGRVDFELLSPDPASLDEPLSEGFAVEASGWKGATGTAIASQPQTERFYRRAAHWAAARGMLRLGFLRLDGRPLAFEYGVRDRGTHYRVKVGFDEATGRFAPGKLHLASVLEDAFASSVARFEFLGDDDAYKLEWATGLRELLLVQVFAPTARGRAAHAAHARGAPAARRVAGVLGRR